MLALVASLALAGCANDFGGGEELARPDGGAVGDARPVEADAALPGVDAVPMWVPGGGLDQRLCPPDSFITHANFGSGFMSEYCVGCHSAQIPANMRQGAPVGVDFDTMDKIREHAPRIYLRAGDDYATMPPAGGPDREARILLGEWLACGMPL